MKKYEGWAILFIVIGVACLMLSFTHSATCGGTTPPRF